MIIGNRTIKTKPEHPISIGNVLFQSPYNPERKSLFIRPDKSKWVGAENFKSYWFMIYVHQIKNEMVLNVEIIIYTQLLKS